MFVTIILPVRNEEAYIADTIKSLLDQDYPSSLLEIIIADGMSTDKTKENIQPFLKKYPNVSLIINPEKIVSTGLNYSIKKAKGDVIVRVDSHSIYPDNYISMLVKSLIYFNADNVGGVCIAKSKNKSLKSRAIKNALTSPFGVGNSYFRIGLKTAREVDTVPFGCFKREVFNKIGLFDVDLVRNQDDEFNARMRKNGMKIYIIPEIKITYYTRKTFKALSQMFFQYGYFKPLVNKKIGKPSTVRQFIPLIFTIYLLSFIFLFFIPEYKYLYLGISFIYCLTNFIFSFKISKYNLFLSFGTMYAIFLQHFSYGLGYIKGIVDFYLRKLATNSQISLSR
jgi:glycosyltransferase involved in cell wall biosynthesis